MSDWHNVKECHNLPYEGLVDINLKDGSTRMNTPARHVAWKSGTVISYRISPAPSHTEKQPRYVNDNGSDWIDECAESLTPEEFRGAMKFTIGKYLTRLGKKDSIEKEIDKVADYAARWLSVEKSRQ